jgi:hypothetical protein
MTAIVQPHAGAFHAPSRLPANPAALASPPLSSLADDGERQWSVDARALARCRALLSRQGEPRDEPAADSAGERHVDVPPAFESFCRSHFASVRRLHAELRWDDARPAYALALAAHAVLCDALDDGREQLLAAHWDELRGASRLAWSQARPLLADGCRALDRLDPLAMRR